MSLGLRLTLINGVVVLMVLAAFAAVSYAVLNRTLHESLDSSLRDQARAFRGPPGILAERFRDRPFIRARGDGRPLTAPDVFIQVVSADGSVIARTRNLDDDTLPIDSVTIARVRDGQESFADIPMDGQTLRAFVAPVRGGPPWDPGGRAIALIVARPQSPLLASLQALRTTFFALGAVGVLVSIFAGWLLARASLRPIDRIAAEAHEIGANRDLKRRVPLGQGRRDEIGRLAGEFNGMLDHLQDAYERLEETLAAQRRFVADASHELRTPLTSLRGNVGLLQRMAALRDSTSKNVEARNEEEEGQILIEMSAEAERLGRLVADLLLLAQADAGQHLVLVETEAATVTAEAFRAARFLREGVAIHLGHMAQNAWVAADEDRLKQTLLILLDNALKYTPTGGEVTISLAVQDRDHQQGVAFSVSDTGPGIAVDEQSRLFERFYRSPAISAIEGAGLGLAIARWIVQEHHGTISVESEPGKGATFTVWLPRAEWEPPREMPNGHTVLAPATHAPT